MEDIERTKVKVINHLTGEITEVEITSAEQAKDIYMELSASETAISKVKKQVLSVLDNWLGSQNNYEFADGKIVRRVQRESRKWTVEGLRKIGLDNDAIAIVSQVNMTAARQLVKEMVEKGEVVPNAGKVLNESADISATKPFLEIR